MAFVLLLGGAAHAGPEWAVVRITSHGGSGVVVYTTQGKTHILTAAHMFEGHDRNRPVTLDAPNPNPSSNLAFRVRVVSVDHARDLAFLEVDSGPWPYVCPIAPAGRQSRRLVSVGYDDMKWPAVVRPVTQARESGDRTLTAERPWYGRSGGALLDPDTGELYGIVSALAGPNNRSELVSKGYGVYASHAAILKFVGWPAYVAEAPLPANPALPLTDGWDGSLRPVPRPGGFSVRPGAPSVSEQRCPNGQCPPGL